MCVKSLPLFLIFVFSFSSIFAQGIIYKEYDWEGVPAIHAFENEYKSYVAVVILQNRFTELIIDATGAHSFITEHKIVHVNSDAGIEKFNKVMIPFSEGKELMALKVRAIGPDGHVTNFKRENLKELKNVEDYGNFKIFAIEGLALGGELEYLYTLKSNPQSYGREIFQYDVPVIESNFELVYPDRLEFVMKSYNGLTRAKKNEFDERRKSIAVEAHNIPALEEEEYSARKANLMRVDYRLTSNGGPNEIGSWKVLSQGILKNLYDPKGTGKISKLLKPLNLDKLTELEKVKAVEHYIKTNFTIKLGNSDAYEDIKEIIASHVGNERGLTKLYLSCLVELGIIPELVIASDRLSGLIDFDFPSPMNLREALFYFPQFKQFLSPGVSYARLGAAPDNVAGGNGLFINFEINGNGAELVQYLVKNIEPLDYTHNNLGVKATVHFSEVIEEPEITQENFWQGYRACQYRGIYSNFPENRREEFIKNVTVSGIENITISKTELEGESVDLSVDADSYFRIKTKYKAPSIVEKAGDDYLISVGKLIGRQSELYQEKQRLMDVAFRSISNYHHELVIEIPNGYTCAGLESIKINNKVDVDKATVMKFESDFQIAGNLLTIKVNEVYKVLSLPKEKYEAFRSVVNSAADFSKLVIILHPSK